MPIEEILANLEYSINTSKNNLCFLTTNVAVEIKAKLAVMKSEEKAPEVAPVEVATEQEHKMGRTVGGLLADYSYTV